MFKFVDEYITNSLVSDKWNTLDEVKKKQYIFTATSIISSFSSNKNRNFNRAIAEQTIYILLNGYRTENISSISIDGASKTYNSDNMLISSVALALLKNNKRRIYRV